MTGYKTICLIVAAGTGTRVGGDVPKQYMNIAGEAVIRHSVLAFVNHDKVDAVRVVYNPSDEDLYQQAIGDLDILSPVAGGKVRQESVRLGLESLHEFSPEVVLIHDGARPLVSGDIIDSVIDGVGKHGLVAPVLEVEDTLKEFKGGKIVQTVDRNGYVRVQTPQGFVYEDILQAHRELKDESFTDDAALMEYLGKEVVGVGGDRDNIKITSFEDFNRAEMIMNSNSEIRVGTGFDVHKFCPAKDENDNKIMLCGVAVPFSKSLEGHSDSDVGLHAIVDAILGAIAEGDIGEHFPPSDNKYKDMDSSEFLKFTDGLLKDKGGVVVNIDVTIICEKPRLMDYKKEMVAKVAEILNIDAARVSVKATTTEGLGFTGRGEGIAAQAVANVRIKS